MGEERGVYRVLVGKPERRRPLGKPRRRWADNIRTDLQEVGCVYMDWIGLAQDRDRWRTLMSAVMNLRVPWNAGSFLTCCRPVSFSRRTLHHGVSKCYLMTLTIAKVIKRRWYMNKYKALACDKEKTEVLGEQPVPVPHCSPQIPQGVAFDWNRASAVTSRGKQPKPAFCGENLFPVFRQTCFAPTAHSFIIIWDGCCGYALRCKHLRMCVRLTN